MELGVGTAYAVIALSIAPIKRMCCCPARLRVTLRRKELSAESLESTLSPLFAVLGQTGSGKSHLALTLAGELRGEIVNFDSVQVHRGLDIGSAKLSQSERRWVPHHLIDVVTPTEELTAGAYARLARPVLKQIRQRGSLPILVGGTGLYLRALLEGLSPAPQRDDRLRARLRSLATRRPAVLHRYLAYRDLASAGRIHPNDHQKLIRAIELAGFAIQSHSREPLQGFAVLKIGLSPDRGELYDRLNRRTAQMFQNGLLEETNALLEAGISRQCKALQSLGYRQAIRVLREGMPLEEAIRECQTKTRQYAKRQLTWFRAEPGVRWLAGFGTDPGIQNAALFEARQFLTKLDSEA